MLKHSPTWSCLIALSILIGPYSFVTAEAADDGIALKSALLLTRTERPAEGERPRFSPGERPDPVRPKLVDGTLAPIPSAGR